MSERDGPKRKRRNRDLVVPVRVELGECAPCLGFRPRHPSHRLARTGTLILTTRLLDQTFNAGGLSVRCDPSRLTELATLKLEIGDIAFMHLGVGSIDDDDAPSAALNPIRHDAAGR